MRVLISLHGDFERALLLLKGVCALIPCIKVMRQLLACGCEPCVHCSSANVRQGMRHESMVELDGTEAADVDAASAADFAQQMLASKARLHMQQDSAAQRAPDRHTSNTETRVASPSRDGLGREMQHEAQMGGSRGEAVTDAGDDLEHGSMSDGDLAAFLVADSDDDVEPLDADEEQQLLSKVDDTPVDMEALPHTSCLLSPQPVTSSPHALKEQFSTGKENVMLQPSSADLLHASSAAEWNTKQRGCIANSGVLNRSSIQQGRKQLRRLYDLSSTHSQQQPSHAAAAAGDVSDEDADLLASSFPGASQPRLAGRSLPAEKQKQHLHAEEQENLGHISGSDDDVSLIEDPSGLKQAARSSTPLGAGRQKASAAESEHARARKPWSSSPRPAQDTNDDWDSSVPQSSGPGTLKRSTSPETSQQRSYGMVCVSCSDVHQAYIRCTKGRCCGCFPLLWTKYPDFVGSSLHMSGP